MNTDAQPWASYIQQTADKSDEQLELESNQPDDTGGNALQRAAAKVEIKKRDREAAKIVAVRQERIAWVAVSAAVASAVATALAAFVTWWK